MQVGGRYNGLNSLIILLGFICALGLTLNAHAQAPSWWTNRLVITNRAASDYSPANQGQAKWIATNAYLEFLDRLPGNGNTNIFNVISSFSATNNYRPINIGQLKTLAKPFYDRIQEGSTNVPFVTNAKPVGVTSIYPWTATTNDDSDYSPANIGQLKYVFSIHFDRDIEGDGVPDWKDAHPSNSYIGVLSVTIDNPSQGSTIH